jgi:hypothetical protein
MQGNYRARLAFEQEQHDEALTFIHGAVLSEVLPNLAAKTLALKIYYAIRAEDLLDAHIDALTQFIRRKKVLGYHRRNYLNIARYTKRLLQLNPFDRKAVRAFRTEIEKEEVLTERSWFLEQLDER